MKTLLLYLYPLLILLGGMLFGWLARWYKYGGRCGQGGLTDGVPNVDVERGTVALDGTEPAATMGQSTQNATGGMADGAKAALGTLTAGAAGAAATVGTAASGFAGRAKAAAGSVASGTVSAAGDLVDTPARRRMRPLTARPRRVPVRRLAARFPRRVLRHPVRRVP